MMVTPLLPLLSFIFFVGWRNEMTANLLRHGGLDRYTIGSSQVEIVERLDSSPKDHHVGGMSTETSHSESDSGKTGNGTPRIAIAVMGQASAFSRWYQILSEQETHTKEQLSFIYGANDKQVSDAGQQRCHEQGNFQSCHAD